MKHTLSSPVSAQLLRFAPISYSHSPCMRVEIYGTKTQEEIKLPFYSRSFLNIKETDTLYFCADDWLEPQRSVDPELFTVHAGGSRSSSSMRNSYWLIGRTKTMKRKLQ